MNARKLCVFVALVAGSSLVFLPAVPAHAGAGCHNPEIRDVAGTHVDLKNNCFVQTVLRVKPGQAVTWTNRDSVDHSVTGVGGTWGDYTTFLRGESVTHRFSRPGVYPYFCYVHPGMVGAVVVGDGGKATATESAGAGVVPVASSAPRAEGAPATEEPAANPVSVSSPGLWDGVTLVTLGLLIAAGAIAGAQRLGVRRSQARARAD